MSTDFPERHPDRALLIQRAVDGERLSAEKQAQVDRWLAEDPAARSWQAFLTEAAEAHQAEAEPAAVPDADSVWASVDAQLEPRPEARTGPARLLHHPVLAAAAGLAAAVLLPLGAALSWDSAPPAPDPPSAAVETAGPAIPGPTPVVHIHAPTGLTVVWVIEPEAPPS
ncbi:MAG: hypothetical protein ACFE0O_10035 [Opitutales bacterium]